MVDHDRLMEKCHAAMDFASGVRADRGAPGLLRCTQGGKWRLRAKRGPTGAKASRRADDPVRHTGSRIGQAEHTRLVEHRKTDRTVHDSLSVLVDVETLVMTRDPAVNEVVIEAGAWRALQRRGVIASFVADDSLFIDIMMNVGIIYYAAQQTSDLDLRRIAGEHCRQRRTLVQGTAAAHEGIFDLETGEFLRQSTHRVGAAIRPARHGLGAVRFGTASVFEDVRFLQTAELC